MMVIMLHLKKEAYSFVSNDIKSNSYEVLEETGDLKTNYWD